LLRKWQRLQTHLGVPNDERLFGTVRLHNGGHNTAPGLVKVSSKTQHQAAIFPASA
jgi:hypothetical protein